jgi:hypothetical protein
VWFVANGKTGMAAMYSIAHEIVLRYPADCLRIVCPARAI